MLLFLVRHAQPAANASISVLYESHGHRYVHAVNGTDHVGDLAAPDVW